MDKLNQRIARFYDCSSQMWENIWGEHMHHGFYPECRRRGVDPVSAQERLIEELLHTGEELKNMDTVLDVGCGIGGSSRYLAEKLNASVVGITLSPYQASRAHTLSQSSGSGGQLSFAVADAQAIPMADETFDLVWSLESAEHFPDKAQFLRESFRVLRPGGTLLMATWCCNTRPLETTVDRCLLSMINRAYALPPWAIPADYLGHLDAAGFADIRQNVISPEVKPFWTEVILRAASPRGMWALAKSGLVVLRGAAVVPLMMAGFQRGTIRFITMSATKPTTHPQK